MKKRAAADYTEAVDDPESLAVWVDVGFCVYGVRANCLRRAFICLR